MNSMNIEKELLNLFDIVSKYLPHDDAESIRELILAGEWGVSFENLCTQLYEYDVKISIEIYNKIRDIGRAMKIKESIWDFDSELVIQ